MVSQPFCYSRCPLKQKKRERVRAMWRQANLKAIIDHQPSWLVWLQCARCNWLGTAIRSFNRKYTLSLSIFFKKWQHWEKNKLSKATVQYKNWFYCRCHSNADPCNQTKRLPAKLHLQSGLKCTAVIISVLRAPCWFLWISGNQHQRKLYVLFFTKYKFYHLYIINTFSLFGVYVMKKTKQITHK